MLTLNNPETFLLRSSIALLVLWLVYVLFLQKETALQFRRYFLLAGAAVALITGAFSVQLVQQLPLANLPRVLPAGALQLNIAPPAPAAHYQFAWWHGWLLVSSVLLLLLIVRLVVLWLRVQKLPKQTFEGQTFRLGDQAYSFMGELVLNAAQVAEAKHNLEVARQLQQVVQHEQVHIRQWHTADLLLAELLRALLWFHPVVWLLPRELSALHEYLADSSACPPESTENYQQLLIRQQLHNNGVLAHHFNKSFIFKRIQMLSLIKKPLSFRKKLLIGLLTVATGLAISCNREMQDQMLEVEQSVEAQQQHDLNNYLVFSEGNTYVMIDEAQVVKASKLIHPTNARAAKGWAAQQMNMLTAGHSVEQMLKELEDDNDKAFVMITGEQYSKYLNGEDILAPYKSVEIEIDEDGEVEVYQLPEQNAEPLLGMSALMQGVAQNEKLLEIARNINAENERAFISFIIDTEGNMTRAEVLKGINPKVDAALVEVMRELEYKWKPAMADGQPVNTRFVLPLKLSAASAEATQVSGKRIIGSNEEFEEATTQATPEGGMRLYMEQVVQNEALQTVVKNSDVEGNVLIAFVVNEDGELTDFRKMKGLSEEIDAAVVAAMRNSSIKWSPALNAAGQPIKSKFLIPFMVKK